MGRSTSQRLMVLDLMNGSDGLLQRDLTAYLGQDLGLLQAELVQEVPA